MSLKKNKLSLIYALFFPLMFFSSLVFAGIDDDFSPPIKISHWQRFQPVSMIALTGGVTRPGNLSSQNFPIIDPNCDSFYNYVPIQETTLNYLGGVFLGDELILNPNWYLQLGISYYYYGPVDVSGNVTQGASLASANTYPYTYTIQGNQLLFEAKLLYQHKECYFPYISVGLGASYNRSSDFVVTITPPYATTTNQFANGSSRSFSYLLGLGIDFAVYQRVRLGVGYRYVNLGTASLGAPAAPACGCIDLTQSNFHIQAVVAQLSIALH